MLGSQQNVKWTQEKNICFSSKIQMRSPPQNGCPFYKHCNTIESTASQYFLFLRDLTPRGKHVRYIQGDKRRGTLQWNQCTGANTAAQSTEIEFLEITNIESWYRSLFQVRLAGRTHA
jgi:hypothetical protein